MYNKTGHIYAVPPLPGIVILAKKPVIPIAKSTTDIELVGISTAAMSGESMPCTAKYNPITL
jgi:hypothetical protein